MWVAVLVKHDRQCDERDDQEQGTKYGQNGLPSLMTQIGKEHEGREEATNETSNVRHV